MATVHNGSSFQLSENRLSCRIHMEKQTYGSGDCQEEGKEKKKCCLPSLCQIHVYWWKENWQFCPLMISAVSLSTWVLQSGINRPGVLRDCWVISPWESWCLLLMVNLSDLMWMEYGVCDQPWVWGRMSWCKLPWTSHLSNLMAFSWIHSLATWRKGTMCWDMRTQ